MAKTFGVTFQIGAALSGSVASAFASVQDGLRATQRSMRLVSGQKTRVKNALEVRQRRDALIQEIRQKGATAERRAELQRLSLQYRELAQSAGVYGRSLRQIEWQQRALEASEANYRRSLGALQTVQRGRDIRAQESNMRKTAMANAMTDVAPVMALAVPLKIGMEFDASMSKVAALSGATGEQFDALRAQARELGATTVWSAREAADGMSFLAMAGFKVEETMAAMPGMLSLASAGGMDLASTADIASNILTGFGKEASEMGHVGNILAKTFTSSNTSIASLGESFKYCAPVAAAAGQSFESVAAMIGKLGDAGIQGSMAGTGLNAIIGRLAKPPKEADAALKKLGVRVADSAGKMRPLEDVFAEIQQKMGKYTEEQQIALAKALYGAEHFSKGFVLQIASASGKLEELKDKLKGADDEDWANQVAKTQNDNLAGDFRQLSSAMQEVAICITDVVTPPLRQLLGHITPMVQTTGAWIKENPRLAQGLMALGGAFVALKAAGLAFTLLNSYRRSFVGGLISMRGQAMRPLVAVRNGFASLRQELARPVSLSFVGPQARIQSFQSRLARLRTSISQTVTRMRQMTPASIAAGTGAMLSGAAAASARTGWNALRLGIRGVGMAFKTAFGPVSLLMMGLSIGTDYVMEHWDQIAPYFQALWDKVKSIFTSVMGWLQPVFDAIAGLFDPFMEKIKSFGGFIGGVLEKMGAVWDWITGNDREKERKAQAAALYAEKQQKAEALFAQMPKEAQAKARADWEKANPAPGKSAWDQPSGVAVNPPRKAAVPTTAQAQAAQPKPKKDNPLAQMQAQMDAMDMGADEAEAPAPKKRGGKGGKSPAAPSEPQIVQPQVQVQLSVTQNGIPEQSFASGVINALKARQADLEAMISGIVNEQARLSYGG